MSDLYECIACGDYVDELEDVLTPSGNMFPVCERCAPVVELDGIDIEDEDEE